jgi:hypothetical protein
MGSSGLGLVYVSLALLTNLTQEYVFVEILRRWWGILLQIAADEVVGSFMVCSDHAFISIRRRNNTLVTHTLQFNGILNHLLI